LATSGGVPGGGQGAQGAPGAGMQMGAMMGGGSGA